MDEQPQELQNVRGATQHYANVMAAKGGPYDLTIVFGRRAGSTGPEWDTEVTMSWEHARSMVTAVEQLIKDYEAKMGDIRDIETAVEAEQAAAEGR